MTKAFLLNLNKKALFFYTVFLQSHTKRDCLNLLDSLMIGRHDSNNVPIDYTHIE